MSFGVSVGRRPIGVDWAAAGRDMTTAARAIAAARKK
jgi:hypothetical protein